MSTWSNKREKSGRLVRSFSEDNLEKFNNLVAVPVTKEDYSPRIIFSTSNQGNNLSPISRKEFKEYLNQTPSLYLNSPINTPTAPSKSEGSVSPREFHITPIQPPLDLNYLKPTILVQVFQTPIIPVGNPQPQVIMNQSTSLSEDLNRIPTTIPVTIGNALAIRNFDQFPRFHGHEDNAYQFCNNFERYVNIGGVAVTD